MMQFVDACMDNVPSLVFVSHMDYLGEKGQVEFKENMEHMRDILGMKYTLLYGFGPKVEDIQCL